MKTCPQCGTSYESAATFCPRDGDVLEETEAGEEMVGRILDGQYEIESFIARGGMGTLYRARHILLGDRVAIKTLKPEMRHNAEWLRRFQREGRAARRFRHPNAVTVYDLRTGADGLTYMVMEYVEGHSLDQELKQRVRLSPVEAWQILEPIVGALEAAHAQGVVHRDLKPENVMLNRAAGGELQVKLLDLGIAKLRDVAETHVGDGGALTLAGQILGTPYYMSPEQWGEPSRDGTVEIDGRADIYSLGVILYELVTGAKPFVGHTLGELRQGHVSHHVPQLHTVVAGVPEEFARAVERAMAKDRADRPATAGVFASEVRAALGLASGANRHDRMIAVLPDFESSQTLIREDDDATMAAAVTPAPRAGGETTPQALATQLTAATAAEQARTRTPVATPLPTTPPPTQPTLHAHLDAQPVARRSLAKLTVVIALALLVAGGVVAGGWLAWNSWQARRAPGNGEGRTVATGTVDAPPARFELMNYWVEAFDDAEQGEGRRVAAKELTLPSGQQFKFHFVARERGYLYIVGPGKGNAPTTFLTARPAGIMKTNLAPAGADFTFPYGDGQVLELDKNPGTEEYVVIFSRTPLLAPAFLATEAGHELTPAELKELEDLRARSKTALPFADVKDSDAKGGAAVAVAVGSAGAPSEPVIFDIRIEHR
ncbi:MAG: eukaryotic-like serine/threonine-protein kinase [Pyrinomonadaceae bacterium]|nr:eukaryotic-like serine/threonine-protein kinase [Pyrinomonadaceae bacterium]